MSAEPETGLTSGDRDVGEQERLQRNESNSQFVFLLKEKEGLKQQLEAKDREVLSLKSKNYDLLKEIEKLESELEEYHLLKKVAVDVDRLLEGDHGSLCLRQLVETDETQKTKKGVKKKTTTVGVRQKDSGKHPVARQNPRKATTTTKSAKTADSKEASKSEEKDTYKFYSEIAERFPNIKLSTVISAERKFIEADVNRSGTIDADELERLFDKNDFLFTKRQVQEILREVDRDNSEDLDFFECLSVIEKLQQNRKTNLPQSLRNAQGAKTSSVCVLQ